MVSSSTPVRAVARCYVEIWRGTSEMVQLLWIYFVLPILVGYQIVPLAAGILVLGLNHGAYGAEIVRGAIQSVPRAQYEGCVALNFTRAQRMRLVILPQALPEMVPPFNNLLIELLKGTALVSVITVADMAYAGNLVRLGSNESAPVYTLLLVLYFLLAFTLTRGMRVIERRANANVGKPQPRRGLLARLSLRESAGEGSGALTTGGAAK